jgi:hypothetical protein
MRLVGALLMLALAAPACSGATDVADELSPRVPAPAGLPEACPAWDAPVRYAEGDLPDGAVSVRLCPGPPLVDNDGTTSDNGIQSPELLTSRVDELVDAVNSLEAPPDDIGCLLDGGPRLAYWFGYRDGDVRAVVFESFGCQFLLIGQQARRQEGELVAQLFTEALLSQRAASQPPAAPPPAPDCRGLVSAPGTTLPHDPVELVSANLCVEDGTQRVRQAEVPTPLLRRLERGLLAEEVSWDESTKASWPHATILGYTRWGDLVRYWLDGCSRVVTPRPAGWLRAEEHVYRLASDVASQLEALPLGPLVRYTSPITKVATPSTQVTGATRAW